MTKEKIIQELQKGFQEVMMIAQPAADSAFFRKHDSKWSAADNVEHLILSIKPLSLAFRLPKFILLFFGKPNRPIMTYDELVKKYLERLRAGGQATSAFVPKYHHQDKLLLLENFKKTNLVFTKSLATCDDADLDRYLLPHPLLGKLYAREMLYFTIYHTQHHLRAIKNCVAIRPAN